MKNSFWRVGLVFVAALAAVAASVPAAAAEAATEPAASLANRPGGRRPYGVITGTVLDSGGRPLAGALVKVVRDGANQIVSESKSASDGSFIARVAPGRYLLRALADGFTPATFTAVEIGPSTELVYRFNLQPAGEGRTTAERRPDRNDPKYKLRSQAARRSIFHSTEGGDETVEAAVAAIEEAEADEDAGAFGDDSVEVSADGDEENAPRRRTRTQGFVETYFASSANPRAGNYAGLNFALAAPVNRELEVILSGQVGEFERLEATARFRPTARHRVSATVGGARLPLAPKVGDEFGADKLGQLSVRATDEWVVREGVVVVLGLDYSRFVGAGGADSFTPRLGFAFDADARTRLRASYAPGADAAETTESFDLESGPVVFKEMPGRALALVDGRPLMERSRRLEFGVERLLDESSSLEATAFFDTVDDRGVGLFSAPLDALSDEGGAALMEVANQRGGARGVRIVYTRRVAPNLKASAAYAFGRGQELSPEGLSAGPGEIFRGAFFQTAAAALDADVLDGTNVRTVLRFSPRAAVFAIDPFAGRLAVYDPSLSILVTQELPNFGLPLRARATIDARNLFDVLTGVEDGENTVSLNVLRRTVRGGISVRF